jgi:ubiquinone biosynthesis protein COQ4
MFGRKSKNKKSGTHAHHIRYLRTLKGVVGMLRDPHHTESVFDIEDGLKDIKAYELAVEHLKKQPEVAAVIRERYLTGLVDVDALSKMPEGTLGRAFAHHILSHGFDPDYFRKLHVKNDLDYVMMRMRQTHDIWHVVTGIGTDPIGELGVKAFELSQTHRPLAAVICAGGVIRYLLKTPEELSKVFDAIHKAYQLGQDAKPFLAQKWEAAWDRPLEDWRSELNVEVPDLAVGREFRPGSSDEIEVSA